MFSFVIVCFQVLFIIMIGAFFRASSYVSTYSQYITFGLITILGFVLMNSIFRKLTLFSLVMLIFITFLAIQTNIIFGTFWYSCFAGFNKQVNISNGLLINSVYAALAVIITCLDFISLFQYWQVFTLLTFVMTIGYGLCEAIIINGLKTFDGGGGISVFLYSGIVSLMIWFLCIRGKISILEHKKSQSYINYTFSFIGVAITFFSWPVLNMGGSVITWIQTNLTSVVSLSNSAYINTLSALGVSLILSGFLSSHHTQSQKLKPKVYIQCFINAGIIVSTNNNVALHPVVGMTLVIFSTIVTVLIDKYLVAKTDVRNQSDFKMVLIKFSKILFRIMWSFVGACIGAIVVKARDTSSLMLLASVGDHAQKAGFIILGWLIVLILGIVFGAISAVSINFYLNYRQSQQNQQKLIKITDQLFFDQLQSEIFPIYKDILEVEPQQTYNEDLTRRMLNQSLLLQQKIPMNIYDSNKKNANHDTNQGGNVQKQTLIIKNDFSKTNRQKGINLSAMKIPINDEPVGIQNVHISKQPIVSRQKVNPIDYSPIDNLKSHQASRFQSLRPQQSRAQKPKEFKTIPSSSRLMTISAIEEQSTNKKIQDEKGDQKEFVRKKLAFNDPVDQSQQIGNEGISRINS